MCKTDEKRRTIVQAYADAFVMKRRESKDVFPIAPDKLTKPTFPLSKIVSLEEALQRAAPRSSARGGKLTAAAKARKKAVEAERKKRLAAAPPAKKPSAAKRKKSAAAPPPARKLPARAAKVPYSPSFP
mmetsp:Transcript_20268/g.52762  ORF Transcript_20268/g.52762 Transcript_20268/m.52762 type:complete len:129 (+) Transcript_20268:386-772(+)